MVTNKRGKRGVGLIGASVTNPGWGVIAHVPALATSPDWELRAIATSSEASGRASAAAIGVPAMTALELIAHPDVDLVAVTVKVPHHAELVAAAVRAGKLVLCEWPVGIDLAQTRMLTELAGDLPNVVGLQARLAPSVRYARDLIAGGYLGEVLATTFSVSGISWTSPAKAGQAYLFDPANGATVLSIAVMHAMDALEYVLGPIAEGRVLAAMRRPTIELDNGERITNRGPDHLAVTATLASGALASVTARGGTSRTSGARWEIHGTEGDLVMTSPIGNFQVLDPVLEGGRGSETTAAVLPVPSTYELAPDAPTGFGSNVARLYAAFAADLRAGTPGATAPNFRHALQLHETQMRIAGK